MFSENTEELAQNKLLLLYIIKMSPYPLSKDELTEFILKKNYMNYFSVQQYLLELVDSNFIEISSTENNKNKYTLLEKGNVTLNYLEGKLSTNIKEELSKDFETQKVDKKIETQIIADYYKKENSNYTANLKLVENDDILFSLYLDVGSESQAKLICSAWKDRTESIYKDIINLLIEE